MGFVCILIMINNQDESFIHFWNASVDLNTCGLPVSAAGAGGSTRRCKLQLLM